jgi:site-specific DNA-methyltransferase (adenine-specific)
MEALPQLKQSDTKEGAFRRMRLLNTVVGMALAAKAKLASQPVNETAKPKGWTLYEGNFLDNSERVHDSSVDLIHTDLPYGASVEKMSSHSATLGFDDSRSTIVTLLEHVASESYRVLRNDRYAVFWFGFNYYAELVVALQHAGFSVSPVPVVWVKNTKSGENPNTRYSNSYEPLLVAVKGQPSLMRPGAGNVKTFATVPPKDKLHVAEKPVELISDILKDLVAPGAVVVDWMAGSGSTAVAAARCKCISILFEVEPAFCTIIKNRLGIL